MLFLLLAVQNPSAPPSPACATPALCQLLQEAAAVNRRLMLGSGGYTATIETENATLSQREGRIEGPIRIEQSAARARWATEAGFDYHTIGAKRFFNGIPLSRMSFLRIGWMVPTLSASRLQVITRSGTEKTSRDETQSGALAPQIAVHPLAEDRDTFYRYSGGEPAGKIIDSTARNVLVIEVTARRDLTREETLFEGELDLDPQTKAVVRMVGRFRIVGRPRRSRFRLPDFEPKETLVELINQKVNDQWVPLVQRFEIKHPSGTQSGYGSGRRMISRFFAVEPLPPVASGSGGIGGTTLGYAMTMARGDSLHRFRDWRSDLGDATETPFAVDFLQYRPEKDRPSGRPIVRIQSFERRDFLRYNRIEGAFTGASLIARMRDAIPGTFFHITGGYAWSEKTARGAAAFGWEAPNGMVKAGIGRSLEVTNDFRNQFDSRAFSALVGRDAWDYLDRWHAGVTLERGLGGTHGSAFRLELARVEEDSVERNIEKSLAGRKLRPNRGIAEGTYWSGKAVLDWNPEVSPVYVRDGVGIRAEVEHGRGDLDYTRVEGRIVLRKTLTRLFFIARLHGGMVFSDAPPPQQLFEIGGSAGFPGYEYKEFAGDRAALFRMRLTYPFPMLESPLRLSRTFSLPALTPAISFGLQGGVTGVRNAAGQAAIDGLGSRYDDKTGELLTSGTGTPLPASVVSDGLRKSIDVRFGFFGDALGIGLARALEKGRHTKLIIAFGRQF